MIFQGLFNILDIYFDDIYLFYDCIDRYFREKIQKVFGSTLIKKVKPLLNKSFKEIINFLKNEFIKLGFDKELIENKFLDKYLVIQKEDIENINNTIELYQKKIAPIVYEIFLEEIVNFLVDSKIGSVILTLKSKDPFISRKDEYLLLKKILKEKILPSKEMEGLTERVLLKARGESIVLLKKNIRI